MPTSRHLQAFLLLTYIMLCLQSMASTHQSFPHPQQQQIPPNLLLSMVSLIMRSTCTKFVITQASPTSRHIAHLLTTSKTVSVRGINHHKIINIPNCTVGGVVYTHLDPVIAIFYQYAYSGKHKIVYALIQMEMFVSFVDEKSKLSKEKQCIATASRYVSPLHIKQGLLYMDLQPYTNSE